MNLCCICDSTKDVKKYKKGNYYCSRHHNQMKEKGKTERTRFDKNEIVVFDDYAEIFLYDRNQKIVGKTKIDLDDVEKCKNEKWHMKKSKSEKPYAQKRTGRILLHHFVLGFIKKDKLEIDHINGDSLDNRKINLRIVTHAENIRNQRKLPKNNTSGHMGVYWSPRNKNWIARIKTNNKTIHLGCFQNIEDAIEARKKGEIKYFGKDKISNFE